MFFEVPQRMKILLTGVSGFIGRNIFEQLHELYTFLAPTHKELDLTDTVAVATYLKRNQVDVVIHTANVGGNRAEANITNVVARNLRIFFNLVRNKQYFKKFIYLGSGTQYGKQTPIVRVKETDFDKRLPEDDFGLYKYTCAKYIEETRDSMVNLILFGIYGKYEPYYFRFISNALCRALFDMPLTISQNVYFDYLYIDDFVKILEYFIENKPKYRTYNLGTGKPIDLVTIAKKVLKITGKKLEIKIAKDELKDEYTCDNNRLMDELGNFRFTNFDETLKRLYAWYESRKTNLDKNSLI